MMKVTIKNASVENGVVKMIAQLYTNKNQELSIKIDTKEKEKMEYLRDKLIRYPWAKQCDKWGEVLRKMPGKVIELRVSKIEVEKV